MKVFGAAVTCFEAELHILVVRRKGSLGIELPGGGHISDVQRDIGHFRRLMPVHVGADNKSDSIWIPIKVTDPLRAGDDIEQVLWLSLDGLKSYTGHRGVGDISDYPFMKTFLMEGLVWFTEAPEEFLSEVQCVIA